MKNLSLSLLMEHQLLGDGYIRDAYSVAKYLKKSYSDKKILIYGLGLHTQELLSSVDLTDFVLGIIKEKSSVVGFKECALNNYTIFQEDEVRRLEFDYIVLLGNWKITAVRLLSEKFGCDEKIFLLPYKITALKDQISQRFVQKNSLVLSNKKPTLVLILAYDRKDVISVSLDKLAKYFNIIKIYIEDEIYYQNDAVSQVIKLNNSIEALSTILNKTNEIDIVCFWISSQFEMWIAYYIKSLLHPKTKFIIGSSDFFFSIYHLEPMHLAQCIGMDKILANINYQSELYCLKNCDGIISNFSGDFETIVKNTYKKAFLYTTSFVDVRSFEFVQRDLNPKEVHICNLGSVEFRAMEDNPIFTSSKFDKLFAEMLKQNFSLHVYNGKRLKDDIEGDFQSLKETFPNLFHWHNFVPSSLLQKEICQYDFGLVIVNATVNVQKVYKTQFNSLFQARIYSYIAAGIPMIVSEEYTFASDFILKYGIGISLKNEEFKDLETIIEGVDYQMLKDNLKDLQEVITKKENNDIVDFFNSFLKEDRK